MKSIIIISLFILFFNIGVLKAKMIGFGRGNIKKELRYNFGVGFNMPGQGYDGYLNNPVFSAKLDFGTEVKVSQTFTNDKTELKSIINSGTADMGGTAFYDAVGQAISDIKDIKDRYKMIIAMTDGMDNSSSKYNHESLIDNTNKIWQPVQVIGYGSLTTDFSIQRN